ASVRQRPDLRHAPRAVRPAFLPRVLQLGGVRRLSPGVAHPARPGGRFRLQRPDRRPVKGRGLLVAAGLVGEGGMMSRSKTYLVGLALAVGLSAPRPAAAEEGCNGYNGTL